nr:MAG TPA: hypothetical protein [Caudoviricetes sp.]
MRKNPRVTEEQQLGRRAAARLGIILASLHHPAQSYYLLVE